MNREMFQEPRSGLYLRRNVWWVSYTINRHRFRESTGYRDRKAAELVLAKIKVGIKEGKWFGKSADVRTPLAQAAAQYLELYAKGRKVSWQEDEGILRRLSEHLGPSAILQDIDRVSIERFLHKLLGAGSSFARVNRYIATLKSFWNRQVEWGKAKTNPLRGIKMYPERMETAYIELGQIRALLAACSDRLRPIVGVALLTGLRQGDILSLRWDQIDFERRQIALLQRKTGSPLTLYVSEPLEQILDKLPKDPDCPYVFHERHRPLKRFGWVRTDCLAATEAAGLPRRKRRFHTLRHTVATQLRFLGKDLALIKEQLGHKSLRMTLRYAHVASEELKRAADQLGERLLGTSQVPESVTLASHCGRGEISHSARPVQNEPSSWPESSGCVPEEGRVQVAVNPAPGRREGLDDTPLRRADIGGLEPE
jgi:integrase